MPRRPQGEAAAADCGERRGHYGGPSRLLQTSGAAAHWLARLAHPRATSWDPRSACTRMERAWVP